MATQLKAFKRRVPSEIHWLRQNYNDNCFLDFFNFFLTYDKRKANTRFKETMKFMADGDQKLRILHNYDKWRKSEKTKNYWFQREQKRQENQQTEERQEDGQSNQSSSVFTNSSTSTPTSSSSATSRALIETISLNEAKALLLTKLLPCGTTSMKDSPDNITTSFARFQAHVFDSLTPLSLLTFETHLQHLLVMSNILLVGKNNNHPDLDVFFTSYIKDIRKSLYESVDFRITQQKFPCDIMMDIVVFGEIIYYKLEYKQLWQ